MFKTNDVVVISNELLRKHHYRGQTKNINLHQFADAGTPFTVTHIIPNKFVPTMVSVGLVTADGLGLLVDTKYLTLKSP